MEKNVRIGKKMEEFEKNRYKGNKLYIWNLKNKI